MKYTVLLDDGTTGTIIVPTLEVGDMVSVSLYDENGVPMEKEGQVKEILEEA